MLLLEATKLYQFVHSPSKVVPLLAPQRPGTQTWMLRCNYEIALLYVFGPRHVNLDSWQKSFWPKCTIMWPRHDPVTLRDYALHKLTLHNFSLGQSGDTISTEITNCFADSMGAHGLRLIIPAYSRSQASAPFAISEWMSSYRFDLRSSYVNAPVSLR